MRRNTHGSVTSSLASAASCRGCGWRRTTASRRMMARSRSRNCSTGGPNCSSTISCSARAIRPVARSTRRSPTPSTALSLTCTPVTRRWSLSHRHHSRSFRRTSVGWAGPFPGSRLRVATSTSTSASRRRRSKLAKPWGTSPSRPGRWTERSRRSSSRTPARRAPTSPATSPRARGSARSSGTATTSIRPTRRRGVDWSSS